MDHSADRIAGLIYPHEMALFTILIILIEIKKRGLFDTPDGPKFRGMRSGKGGTE